MRYDTIIWDMDDDPDGNVQHCADHDISVAEVEDVIEDAIEKDFSRSSNRPVVFGNTRTGRHLMVVFDEIDAHTIYPVTACEVPRRQRS